ncbi:hypothetical protein N9D70_00325 [bacterium]|jgi:hypothetical protein|nr:hypothetical protein [bacterium]
MFRTFLGVLLLSVLVSCSSAVVNHPETQHDTRVNPPNANLYFFRTNTINLAARNFEVIVDNEVIGKIGRKEVISFKASGGSHTIETRLTGLKFGSEPGSRLVFISGEEVKYFEISFGGFTSLGAQRLTLNEVTKRDFETRTYF